jgi:hypothetical protein
MYVRHKLTKLCDEVVVGTDTPPDRAYIIVCSLLGDTLSRSLYNVYIIFTIEPLLGVSWPFLTLDLSQKTSVF